MGTLTFQAAAGGTFNLNGPNIAGTVNLTLPSADGSSGQPLQTNGSGTLSFANLAIANGGTGVTSFTANQIHYGSFSQSAGLTFDGTNFATTGTATAAKLIPTGSSASGNGMYLPATNSVGISTNGTNAVYIDSNQNVGIGTSSPSTYVGSGGLAVFGTYGTSTTAFSIANNTGFSASNIARIDFRLNNSFGGNERTAAIWSLNPNAAANNGGALVLATSANGTSTTPTEAVRIDSSGNLLVGTTASTGSISNTAPVVAGVFKTLSGTVVAASATATTIATLPSVTNGTYIVSCGLAASDPTNYSAVSLVTVDGTVLRSTNLQTAALMSISVSGQTVRATQASGGTSTIYFTLTRVS